MNAVLALRDYIQMFRRRLWIVVFGFLGVVVLALLWTALQTPM